MEPAEQVPAGELIAEVDRVRAHSRARVSIAWFPLLLFGALTLLSVPVVVWFGGAALGPYWLVAGPAGGITTGIVAARHGRRVGAEAPGSPYVAVAVLILAGAAAAGWAGAALDDYRISAAGPSVIVALGYLAYARLERSWVLAWTAGGLAALTAGLLATGLAPEPLAAVLAGAYGLVFVATGLALRWGWRR